MIACCRGRASGRGCGRCSWQGFEAEAGPRELALSPDAEHSCTDQGKCNGWIMKLAHVGYPSHTGAMGDFIFPYIKAYSLFAAKGVVVC